MSYAPVASVLPRYRSDTASKIQVHHLLTHGSGIPNFASKEFYTGGGAGRSYSKWEFIEQFCSGDLDFEPGTSSRYSDPNFVLLAAIVEEVTGTTFPEAMEDLVFGPLGMSNTEIVRPHATIERLASSSQQGHLLDHALG